MLMKSTWIFFYKKLLIYKYFKHVYFYLIYRFFKQKKVMHQYLIFILIYMGIGDWVLGIGDWAHGDWAQSPIPNPQSPIPNPHLKVMYFILKSII